ncbi:uncharacterized protein Dwil_GK10844 [Drosophila willistoni]|uniref:INO80 complex subunit E N-terminal domain-containing protein n=1 Tax=Drosophila willistoni TaxID=7260 RepID=B4NA08_DROWI|nr:transforming growth factor beta regulator 1 [Drosophila willistoni]EDW81763.1 uncharacterized protein Dwil_GK10844 [Drosophila willistoni]
MNKYEQRYRRLKRSIKTYLLENSSIADEICHVQGELTAARSERLFLIERLMFHEGLAKNNHIQNCSTNEKSEIKDKTNGTPSSITQDQTLPKTNTIDIKSKNTSTARKKKSMFPINLTNILLHCLGEIIPGNPNFHTSCWIYPVGYVATRIYAHPKDPKKKCVFTCKILNNAGIPQFQIIPDNDLDGVFFGESANICHQELITTIQRSFKDNTKAHLKVQGEVFFGLSNAKTQSLLMLDANFKCCTNFKGFNLPNNENNDPALSFEELQTYLT